MFADPCLLLAGVWGHRKQELASGIQEFLRALMKWLSDLKHTGQRSEGRADAHPMPESLLWGKVRWSVT